MMRLFTLLLLATVGSAALAYQDGEYRCKNGSEGLPENVYKIHTVSLSGGMSLPYVEIVRHSRVTPGDPKSPQRSIFIKGLASVSSFSPGTSTLTIGTVRLEFEGGSFINCRAP